jgi:hypothetical protein
LSQNHFIICIEKNYYKIKKDKEKEEKKAINHIKKVDYLNSDKYIIDVENKAIEGNKEYNPLIFDIESYNEYIDGKYYQTPILVGFCRKKDNDYIYNSFIGDNCQKDFIAYLQRKNYTHLIGFNSGKYDYILLRNEIINQGGNLKEYRNSANGILRATISFKSQNIDVVDLRNFTMGNLRNNLLTFKCEVAKGEIDYSLIAKNNTKEFNNELNEYCKLDCIGTYQLFEKLQSPFIKRGLIFLDLFTASQGSYKILKYYWKKQDFNIPKFTLKYIDSFFRKALYGGRCEVFKREYIAPMYKEIRRRNKIFIKIFESIEKDLILTLGEKEGDKIINGLKHTENDKLIKLIEKSTSSEEINNILLKYDYFELLKANEEFYNLIVEFMRALDVNSLYPSAMRNNLYPIGEPIFTFKFMSDKLGIYECSSIIKPKNLLFPVCYDKQFESYNLFDLNNVNYTSIDIIQMRKYGYIVKIKNGYYWDKSEYIYRDYTNDFYEIKKNSAKGSPQYENAKLSLNAPYGKELQGDKNEIHFSFKTKEELEKAKKENKNGVWSGYVDINNETLNFTFSSGQEDKTTRKRAFSGAFILSYSKLIMYDMINISNPYYTDTDSLYIENSYSPLFKISKELGEFSDDYDGKIIYGSFVAKKLKYIEILRNNGHIEKCYTGKGCYKNDLTKTAFKKMLSGQEYENKGEFKMIRDLNGGKVEYYKNDIKIIKMNDGNRYFKENNFSYPLGHMKTINDTILKDCFLKIKIFSKTLKNI